MKKYKETMLKGILTLLISQILIKIIGFIYKVYLTNKPGFGDHGNAIYSAGFQIYALLLTLSSTGVPNAISKLVSERVAVGDNRGAYNIFRIALFVFAFFGIIGSLFLFLGAKIIAIRWLEIPEAEYSIITLSPSVFFVSITAVFKGYFNGRQNLSATANSQTLEQIFKTILTILFVETIAITTKNNTILMAGVANLATTVATFGGFSYIYFFYKIKRKEIALEISESVNYVPTRIRKTLKIVLKESIPVSISSLMSSFNKNIDLFTVVRILKKYMSESMAKIQYGILSGKVDVLCTLPLALNIPFVSAMVPNIAKYKALNNEKELKEKIEIFFKITIIIGFAVTVLYFIFSKQILKIIFPNFCEGDMLLKINSISIIFTMLAQTINGMLQGIGKQNIPAVSFSIGMIIKFFINIVLINKKEIGINGAVIGNIVCNFIVVLIGGIILFKNLNFKIDIKKFIFKEIIVIFLTSINVICIYVNIKSIFSVKVATIIAIGDFLMIYFVLLKLLKMLPVLQKIKKIK